MRDRLIELIGKELLYYASWNTEMALAGNYTMPSVEEVIADKILKDGWIRPPCKVGDVVKCDEIYYHIYRMQAYEDYDTPIHYRYWAEPITDEGEDDFWFWSDSLGEGTVIVCSKEEAEQALKGGV